MQVLRSRRLMVATVATAVTALVIAVLGLGAGRASADEPARFTFSLWGDVPYAKANNAAEVPLLVNDMNAQNLAFTVFDGDTKDGSSRCDNVSYTEAIARFNSTSAPTVYVPGDNEWTDCHRSNNGDYNALERLDYVRKNLFATVASFGKTTMPLEHQGPVGGKYAENTRWVYGNVAFVGINMPGSNNGFVKDSTTCADGGRTKRTAEDCMQDWFEAQNRDAANIDWMRQTFTLAKQRKLAGVMIIAQADPGFDLPETAGDERSDPALAGYTNFVNAMAEETQAYSGQVVYVHGDTHFFKVDKPLAIDPSNKGANKYVVNDNARTIGNFTRLQTFGSANVQWVKVTVDPTSRNLFIIEPMIVPAAPR